jgi:Ni,Fe-hydrogenase III component G
MMDAESTFETVRLLLEDWVERFETTTPSRLDVYMKDAADLVAAVVGLRVKRLGYLAAITGLDKGPEAEELEVLYHFCVGELMINMRFQLPKGAASMDSLSDIIPSAESFERELSEMFGISIRGLRIPGHLYLPDHWPDEVFPLRKGIDPRIAFQKN